MKQPVGEDAMRRVKRLTLPNEEADELGYFGAPDGARGNDRSAFGWSIGNRARGVGFEEVIELLLTHVEQLWDI